MDQDTLIRAASLQQSAEEIEKNLQMINEQVNELIIFREQLKGIELKEKQEIFASVGKGVYTKAITIDPSLYVNVGAGVILKKTPEEILKVIETQIIKFQEIKSQLNAQLQLYLEELQEMVSHIEHSH